MNRIYTPTNLWSYCSYIALLFLLPCLSNAQSCPTSATDISAGAGTSYDFAVPQCPAPAGFPASITSNGATFNAGGCSSLMQNYNTGPNPGSSTLPATFNFGMSIGTCAYSGAGALLPVQLVSFKANGQNGDIALEWNTAMEINNEGFEVQRSNDGNQWAKLTFVPGQHTVYEAQHYRFVDEQPLEGMNYYRLKQMDFDGSHEFSPIVNVQNGKAKNEFHAYPNPVTHGELNIVLPEEPDSEYTVLLMDASGKLVSEWALNSQSSTWSMDGIPSGIYHLQIRTANENLWKKIVVE